MADGLLKTKSRAAIQSSVAVTRPPPPLPFAGVFYSQLTAADFIIDVLVGSSQSLVRDAALRWFDELRLTEPAGRAHDSRRHLLAALLHARLPFWVSSSNTRGASHRWAHRAGHPSRCGSSEHGRRVMIGLVISMNRSRRMSICLKDSLM